MPHPIEAYARHAYAAGVAASGAPLTERVHRGCQVAVALAVEHADDPRILEVTLQLGQLEGMWATLFDRREKLITQYTATVTQTWRQLIRPRLFRDGLHNLRAELGLAETDQTEQQVQAACTAAATAMLAGLPLTPGWAALREALRNALAAGQAEGMVGAVAVAAERANRAGLDWDKGFASAYQQLERLDTLWSQAETWLDRLVQRAVASLARVLAAAVASGASHEEMLDACSQELDGDDVEPVDFTTDWAMTTAMGAGALGLYALYQALAVTWTTAGDGRVCATCDDNESNSPYALGDVPAYPAHPRCRCQLEADFDLSRFADWFTT